MIYTSGSTGLPRGVILSHRGLVNHTLATSRMFDLGPGDRVLQFASLSFDLALEEIFPAWTRGATVVFREPEIAPPAEFAKQLDDRGITVLDLPTAFWHAWIAGLDDLGVSLPTSLRLLVVGGEEALPSSLAIWRRIGGERVRWINTYGPTEASVIASAHELPGSLDDVRSIPIGRPIANMRAYVLDGLLQQAPIGVPGELYLGGEGVARGYLRIVPGETAARFVPDPFLCKWRPGSPGSTARVTVAKWARRRESQVPRPPRRSDQGPRLPGSSPEEIRVGSARPSRCPRGRRLGAHGGLSHGVRRAVRQSTDRSRRTPSLPRRTPPAAPGPGHGLRAGVPPFDTIRQGRSPGPARDGRGSRCTEYRASR